jgi:ABC-2 type transport system ATP-binding protein
MIEVEGLTKRFGQVSAVENLSFRVEKGEVIGFLGPNGAGKTTTMRILTGFLPPTTGRASVAGHDVFEHPLEVKRRVGYLPESVPVYSEMPVGDYLGFIAELKAVPRGQMREAVDRAMALTDIADRRSRIIGHLSKGYRKRVGIAQALLHNPDVLILDEPTEGLDPNQVVSIRALVKSLAGTRTIIVSTHILPEVEQTCTRVLIIDKGRLVASDTVEHIRDASRTGVRYSVRVRGDAGTLRSVLSALPGVRLVSAGPDGQAMAVAQLDLSAADGAPEVAAAVVRSGLGLLEMSRERRTLEAVFLELTGRAGVEEGVRS